MQILSYAVSENNIIVGCMREKDMYSAELSLIREEINSDTPPIIRFLD